MSIIESYQLGGDDDDVENGDGDDGDDDVVTVRPDNFCSPTS